MLIKLHRCTCLLLYCLHTPKMGFPMVWLVMFTEQEDPVCLAYEE